MSDTNAERRVWANSAAGYTRSLCRLVLGVVSFRLLCTELSTEELGFYGLLWSLLGYGVLFDLGMGVAVQKRTAELIQRKDWTELSRVLSSVSFCNCVWAIVIIIGGRCATDPLLRSLGVSEANQAEFRLAMHIFFFGMGLSIPFEMFREVLYGQQRIAFSERLSTASGVVSFLVLFFALHLHWGLPVVLGLQMMCVLATGIMMTVSALRAMPEVRLDIRQASWTALRGIARFSALAYVAVITGVVVLQTDRLLVGAVLSISAVAAYHVGAKVPEIFGAFTRQLPEALAPAAATLHDAGHRSNWQQLFLRGMRLNALVTTPLFILSFVFLEGLLALLTRGRTSGLEVVWLGRLLLVWSYSTILTHGVSKAIFLMSGHEARLVRLLVAEALGNIVLSFVLLQWLDSPLGAAVGSLVPALILGWVFLWPWTAREVGMGSWQLARKMLLPAMLASLPAVLFGLSCRFVPLLDFRSSLAAFFADSAAGVALVVMGTWCFALSKLERALVARIVRNRLRRILGIRSPMEDACDITADKAPNISSNA